MRGRSLMIAGMLTAAFAGQAFAQTSVVGSAHDLSAETGTDGDNAEVCVYCHTPHGAGSVDAPLWNRIAGTDPFTPYSSATLDGEIAAALGSVSIACMSCHDGSQSRDVVLNAPGSGAGDLSSTNSLGALTGIADLSGDLSNDHPIGIEYGGWEVSPGVQIDPDFVGPAAATEVGLKQATGGQWYIDDGDDVKEKTDLMLFANVEVTSGNPTVECATCHDPHSGQGITAPVGDQVVEVNFLRMSNEGSDLCLACHVK